MIQQESFMQEAIEMAIKEAVNKQIEKYIEEAKAKVEKEIRNSADSIALNLLSYYDVRSNEQGIVITVKKGVEK